MLLYVAGPYRPNNDFTTEQNIDHAKEIAVAVWQSGNTAICPHLNTANFEDLTIVPDEAYLEGYLNILCRCDGVVMAIDWEKSKGATAELEYAKSLGIPVWFYPDLPTVNLTEKRCPQQCKSFLEIVMSMYRLHLSKNADYSPANILGTGEIGLITRLWDKIARLMNLQGFRLKAELEAFEQPRSPKHEAIEDTYHDAAVYSVIGLLLRRGVWGK